MDKKQSFKKLTKLLGGILVVFVVGGIGGVYFEQYVLPRVRTNKVLSRIDFFKKTTENITVINKTEQFTVKEDDSLSQLIAQNAAKVVGIISQPASGTQNAKNMPVKKGTGLIGTSDGMIVTYRSVIWEKSADYKVLLSDGSVHEAVLVGVDEFTNLAFLKIEAANLSVATFADSDNVTAGKKLLALSGWDKYVTGILSGKNKTFNLGGMALSVSDKLEGIFQADFRQDLDFVGGPAMSYSGEVVGIGGVLNIDNQAVYFQIPANMLKKSLELALNQQLAQRPFFGAYYIPLTKEYALTHGVARDKGALIYSPSGKQSLAFIEGSPAEKAGLRINDIVVKVAGQEVDEDKPLANLLGQYKKRERLELTVQRAGQELNIVVML